ncbi:MAG: four helix bundle protein [Bacteroidales bacterium]|nr:four helix bundle protein [Bacteroidales bacterium]
MHNYKKLIVWQKAVKLAVDIYNRTKGFPDDEKFGMTIQSRKSACSIAYNIAEGSRKSSGKDFNRFLEISDGSSAELNTQLIISKMVGYITDNELASFENRIDEIQRMIKSLKEKNLISKNLKSKI